MSGSLCISIQNNICYTIRLIKSWWIIVLIIITKHIGRDGTLRFIRNGVADTNQSWSSGIVQVYYNDSWGNICDSDSSFGSDEADVICHQLSYIGASSFSNTGISSVWVYINNSVLCQYNACLHLHAAHSL